MIATSYLAELPISKDLSHFNKGLNISICLKLGHRVLICQFDKKNTFANYSTVSFTSVKNNTCETPMILFSTK